MAQTQYQKRGCPVLGSCFRVIIYSLFDRSSVIRLSLGRQLVNLLQVVKRTNTALIPSKLGVVGRIMGFLGVQ